MAVVEHKECSCCHRILPLSAFSTRLNAKGVAVPRGVCKECVNAKQRKSRASRADYSTFTPKKVRRKDSLGVARPAMVRFVAPDEECDVFSVSRGSGYKVQVECPYCGSRKKVRANALSRSGYELCPNCDIDDEGNLLARRPSRLLVDNVPEAREWWDDERDVSTVTVKSNYRAQWKCPTCGVRFAKAVRHFSPSCDCSPVVGDNSLVVVAPHVAAELSGNNDMRVESLSCNSARVVEWECDEGHVWRAPVYQRVNSGTGCPECLRSGTSAAEVELRDYVGSLVGASNIVSNSRSVIAPHELDIYIPSKSVAIEFNGLYWHSEAQGKDKRYHYDKWRNCKDAGVQLITVWEDDWRDRQAVVKSMIAHKLGMAQSGRVFARKTTVVQLTSQQARAFCNAHHIQGFVQGSAYLGLVDSDGAIVAVSIWRKNVTYAYLERYCTSCVVVGGMGKLLACGASWARSRGLQRIVTFADREVSDGGLYDALGFTADKELPPGYKYVVDGKRVHKFSYRRKRFRADPDLRYEESLSERELACLNGLGRVWDCGKIRYVKQL